MKKYYIILISILFLSASSYAQDEEFAEIKASTWLDEWLMNINFGVGMPAGDLSDFLDGETSYRDMSIELKRVIGDHFAVGGRLGWAGFYQKFDRTTYEFPGGAVTSSVFNYMYIVPIQAVANYFPLADAPVQPYVGLGFGVFSNTRKTDLGLYGIDNNDWRMGITPEIGVVVPLGDAGWGLEAKYSYNYIFYNELEFDQLSYMDLKIGIVISF